MEEAVCCKDEEDFFAVTGQHSEGQRKEETVGKTGLANTIEHQGERGYAGDKCEDALENPGEVRDNAAHCNPL